MLGSNEGIMLGLSYVEVIGTILVNVNGITLGIDVGIDLEFSDGSLDGSKDGKLKGLLLG